MLYLEEWENVKQIRNHDDRQKPGNSTLNHRHMHETDSGSLITHQFQIGFRI